MNPIDAKIEEEMDKPKLKLNVPNDGMNICDLENTFTPPA